MSKLLHWKSSRLNLQTMTGMAMLCALYVVLQMVTINISPMLQITFSFVPLALSCYLYGFWPNVIFCFAADFLGFIVHPDGAYMPLFAFILVVKAWIYTMVLFRKQIHWVRVAIAQFSVDLIGNIFLTPLLLSMMYSVPYWAAVSTRLVKNAILFPIETVLLLLVFQAARQIPVFKKAKIEGK